MGIPFPVFDEERAVVLYEKGYTTVQIGVFFEVSTWSVREALIRRGVTMRPQNSRPRRGLRALARKSRCPWTDEDDQWLRSRVEWGFTYAEVAGQLGRSEQACKVRAYKIGMTDKTGQRRQARLAETRQRIRGKAERRRIGQHSRRRAREPGAQEDFGRRMHDPETRARAVAALRLKLRGYEVPPEREEEYKYYKKVKKMTVVEIRTIMGL